MTAVERSRTAEGWPSPRPSLSLPRIQALAAADMAAVDRDAAASGLSSLGLMERAGQAVAAAALGIPQKRALFDTVLMGWNTYQVGGVPSPYAHLRQIVFSRSRTAEGENLEVTSEDPIAVVRRLKLEEGAAIWLCGGGALAATLADEIDRLVLKRQPLLFGSGIPLFGERPYRPEQFDAVETVTYDSGVVFTELERRHEG